MLLYWLYNIISKVFGLIAKTWVQYRLIKGKEHAARCLEKIGIYSEAIHLPKKQHPIWFHVASVGELNSIMSLVKELSHAHSILISSCTLHSFKVFEKAGFNFNVNHVFAPFDTPKIVRSFLRAFKPCMGIFVDSELWPNLLYYAAQKMPLINLNARLSDKSANLWGYFPWFARYIYSQFNLVLPCSQDDYVKISRFVDQNKLEFIGNLKLTSGSVPVNNETLRSVQDMFFKRFIVVLASTHPGEEKLVLQVMGKWLSNNPDIALVIAPRHPERREEIESVLSDLDISYCVRSKKQNFGPEYQVYLADTIGEMGAWYQLSRIVIMGGSFVPVGGHNIIEPAKLDNAVLIGPYYYNFRDAVKLLSDNGAIEVLNDVNALVQVLDNLYKNSEILEHQAYAAYKCSDAQEILRKAMAVIEKQLAPEDLI